MARFAAFLVRTITHSRDQVVASCVLLSRQQPDPLDPSLTQEGGNVFGRISSILGVFAVASAAASGGAHALPAETNISPTPHEESAAAELIVEDNFVGLVPTGTASPPGGLTITWYPTDKGSEILWSSAGVTLTDPATGHKVQPRYEGRLSEHEQATVAATLHAMENPGSDSESPEGETQALAATFWLCSLNVQDPIVNNVGTPYAAAVGTTGQVCQGVIDHAVRDNLFRYSTQVATRFSGYTVGSTVHASATKSCAGSGSRSYTNKGMGFANFVQYGYQRTPLYSTNPRNLGCS